MFTLLYPLSFLAALITLSLWFYFQQNKGLSRLLRVVFFLVLAVYVVSLGLQSGSWDAKWTLLVRDMAIMAVVPSLLSLVRNRSWLFFALLGAGIVSMMLVWNRFDDKLTASEPEGEWELLLELKEGSQLDQLDKLTHKYGLLYERAFLPQHPLDTDLDDYFLVEIPENNEDQLDAISTAFLQNAAVDWVEKNDIIQVAPMVEVPTRTNPQKKYGVNDPGLDFLWGFEEMDVAGLYQFFRESGVRPVKKSLIAILDTGVDGSHEDLKDNFQSTNAKYNKDRVGHGTHCAGIAAAVSNNALGIASFSPDNSFYSVTSIKVLNDFGSGTQADILKGIIEAADLGADVISMSLGGRSDDKKQLAYQKAVEYANKAGAIVVVAAGNDGAFARDVSPANTPGVIVVSALDTLLHRASFSNRITGLSMPLAAPGVSIYSTVPGNKYKTFNGTSMATPYVAGVVGLLKAFKPALTTKEAWEVLNKTGAATNTPEETGACIQPGKAIRRLLDL
ncbi:MAG: S8 family serine peptidase [Saprospirales bacterium]|nr:S8 family serine peptidase [Saprospirales bacterium]